SNATQSLGSLMYVLGYCVVGVFGLFGVAKIVEMYVAHRLGKQDKKQADSDANEGKRIDADQAAVGMFRDRLNFLESRLDTQNTEIIASAKLTAEQASDIKHLTEDNLRLQSQLERARAELKDQRDGM